MYNNINTNSVIYCISNQIDPVLEFGKKIGIAFTSQIHLQWLKILSM